MRLKPDIAACLVLGGFSLALWVPRLVGPIDLRFDAAVYYVLGTSLAEGNGYRLLNEPGEIRAVQYPPMLPAIVAAWQMALGTHDVLPVGESLRWTYCAMYVALSVAVFIMARRFLPSEWSFFTAFLVVAHLQILYLSDLLFAELPFMLALVLVVVFSAGSSKPFSSALAAAAAVAAYLLRTAGLAVLLAWVGESLVRRQWRQAALRAAIAAIPVIAWQGYVRHVTRADSQQTAYEYQRAPYQYYNVTYGENLSLIDPFIPELGWANPAALAARAARNLLPMPAALGEALSTPANMWRWMVRRVPRPFGSYPVPTDSIIVPLFMLGAAAVAGVVLLWQRGEKLIPLIVLFSIGLVCLTPWPEQLNRYLTTITPFLALAFGLLLKTIHGWTSKQPHRRWSWADGAVTAAVAAILLIQVVAAVHLYRSRFDAAPAYTSDEVGGGGTRLFYYDPQWMAYDRAVRWLGRHADPGDLVASATPQMVYLKTGLKSIMPPMVPNPADARRLLTAAGVRYVVVDELAVGDVVPRYVEPAMKDWRGEQSGWEHVYSAPQSLTHIFMRSDEHDFSQ